MADYGATATVIATAFTPGSLSVKEVVGTILAEFRYNQAPKAIKLHNLTIRTWFDPPKFDYQFRFAGGEANLQIIATGTEKEIWKWVWLDEGTSVRHAKLSSDWVSKTRPGYIGSGPGRGRVQYISKDYVGAGIEPRFWSEEIAAKMEASFAKDIQAAIDRGIDLAEKKGKVINFG